MDRIWCATATTTLWGASPFFWDSASCSFFWRQSNDKRAVCVLASIWKSTTSPRRRFPTGTLFAPNFLNTASNGGHLNKFHFGGCNLNYSNEKSKTTCLVIGGSRLYHDQKAIDLLFLDSIQNQLDELKEDTRSSNHQESQNMEHFNEAVQTFIETSLK